MIIMGSSQSDGIERSARRIFPVFVSRDGCRQCCPPVEQFTSCLAFGASGGLVGSPGIAAENGLALDLVRSRN